MICAIDFGSCWLRSAFRREDLPGRLTLFEELSEYALLPDSEVHRQALDSRRIPFAVCDDSLLVVGNSAPQVRWLTRLPLTPLFVDGTVPTDDAPARQVLAALTGALLPGVRPGRNLCAIVVPGPRSSTPVADHSSDFLCRLVQMQGYQPLIVAASEAALLATGASTQFTGVSVVIGGESTSICIGRLGQPLASETVAIGANWIDSEFGRQFEMQVYDDRGTCYLDLEAVRRWKVDAGLNLRTASSDRERQMCRLYTVLLDRVVRSIGQLLEAPAVTAALDRQRLVLTVAGGASRLDGMPGLISDRLAAQGLTDRIAGVRLAADPSRVVVRGALIAAELHARCVRAGEAA
jgi:hypothetical protein